MTVDQLMNVLKLMPQDMEVRIRTTPNDYTAPFGMSNMTVEKAFLDNGMIDHASLLLTAFYPSKRQSP